MTLLERFWSKVDRSAGPDGCWLWTRPAKNTGYGQFWAGGRGVAPHRFALELALGRPVTAGAFVLHSCDNRLCCNPAHLREGTPAENTRDAMARDRLSRGEHHYSRRERHRCPRGERNGSARITEQDARSILALVAAGHRQVDVARRFNIGQPHVSSIVRGVCWAHLHSQETP